MREHETAASIRFDRLPCNLSSQCFAPVIALAPSFPPHPPRSYIRRFFVEEVENYKFTGLAWLFMGVANSDAKLYDDEFQAILKRYPDQFRLDYALSREQTNTKGGKMYIQDKARARGDRQSSRTPSRLSLCTALAAARLCLPASSGA